MKNKKSKKVNPALSDYNFVTQLSHQMRTPISIIKESVSLLLDEIPGSLNEKQKKVLNICKSNVKRLVDVMNEILNQLYREAKIYEELKGDKDEHKRKDTNCRR